MLIGYARVSKTDGFPVAGPAARRPAGRGRRRRGLASGVRDDRLDSCLRVLRKGDVRVVCKLDRSTRRHSGSFAQTAPVTLNLHACWSEAKPR